jgi:UDP-N-acetylmuramoyl-L-alanyl-D-glutamate--2,6-diaminopimelate ligase
MSDRPQNCPPVVLRDLAARLGGHLSGDGSVLVSGIFQDSRRLSAGSAFVMRGGGKTDGALYVEDAIARGAVALIVARGHAPEPARLPVVEVDDVRGAIGAAAAIVYGNPSDTIDVVGITGTNGKTTTCWLTASAIAGAGKRPGIVGTIGYVFEDLHVDAPHTTPEADDLLRVAAEMRGRGATHLVMEVSSHALSQARVDALRFRVAAFTNLTQDHLDFHGDMASYGDAKARLFTSLAPAAAVINIDDPFGEKLTGLLRMPMLRVSSRPGARADVLPLRADLTARGIRATVATPKGPVEIDSRLIGGHNLSNLLVALGIAAALGIEPTVAAAALSKEGGVPGRLERCDGPDDDVVVVVDYAHTPDALERVLSTLKPFAAERGKLLLCVFGCGGDRDPKKRAPMGRAVGGAADAVWVTSDNPRSESPDAIIAEILPGLQGSAADVVVEPDRARAIEAAIATARPGDVVLVAGKGHETYQIMGGTTRPFDDRKEARRALAKRRGA